MTWKLPVCRDARSLELTCGSIVGSGTENGHYNAIGAVFKSYIV